MAKHRKTRKEKEAADHRISFTPQPISTSAPSPLFTISQSSAKTSSAPAVTRIESEHLVRDLIKTSLLTSSIVIAEIILAFVIKL